MPENNKDYWTVGVTETCERLGVFATHDEAAEFIGTLPNHEEGIYYLDGPCRGPLEMTSSPALRPRALPARVRRGGLT